MPTTTTAPPSYITLFHEYILAALQQSLDCVRAAEPLVPEAEREQAWHLLSFALNVDAAWPCVRDLLLALAAKMEQAGFREEWLPYLEEGMRRSQHHADQQAEAELHLQIGLLYRLQSKFDKARTQLTASVAGFAALRTPHDQARALNELAWLDHLQHRYAEATEHVEAALALLDDEDPERAMCYRVLGMVAIDYEHWQTAEEFHHQALTLFEKQADRRKIAWSLQNLAYALRGQARFEEAIALYQRSAVILEELGDTTNWAIVQLNLGADYLYYGKPDDAIECHLSAEIVFRKFNDRLNIARINTNLGLDYLALKEYANAETCFLLSSQFHDAVGNKHLSLNALDGLALTYLANKEYYKAHKILDQALEELPQIKHMPNYNYLLSSLNEHLREARQGQQLSIN